MVKVKCKVKDLMKVMSSKAFLVALEAAKKSPNKRELWVIATYGNGIRRCHITHK